MPQPILVVVQARTGSSRLPGKILLPLAGKPLLERMLERVRASATPFDLVVATTTAPEDEPVRELCRGLSRLDVRCMSGHPTDLLDRHYQAARQSGAQVVVKIPSDCPLIDPRVIDRVLELAPGFGGGELDYVGNLHPATYPDGNDVEAMTFAALETAWREAVKPHEREHTTPFLWDQPERFALGSVLWETGQDLSLTHRFTIDYPEDYRLIAAVYDALWTEERPIFGLEDIVRLLDVRPDLFALNARYAGVNWYRHHLGELRTVQSHETRSPES
jgi:spore coat polysaccharide biosynthesis protein SpsF